MTAITFNTAARPGKWTAKLHSLLTTISKALDAYAAHRMEHAVPEYELRRAERTIGRYRRLMENSGSEKPARRSARSRGEQAKR